MTMRHRSEYRPVAPKIRPVERKRVLSFCIVLYTSRYEEKTRCHRAGGIGGRCRDGAFALAALAADRVVGPAQGIAGRSLRAAVSKKVPGADRPGDRGSADLFALGGGEA